MQCSLLQLANRQSRMSHSTPKWEQFTIKVSSRKDLVISKIILLYLSKELPKSSMDLKKFRLTVKMEAASYLLFKNVHLASKLIKPKKKYATMNK